MSKNKTNAHRILSYTTRIIYVLLAIFTISCSKETVVPNGQTADPNWPENAKIMLLGDSRVEGASPEFESYRYELWKKLVDVGWSFDLVGNQVDDYDYPDYMGQSFDGNHEGYGGYTTKDILKVVKKNIPEENVPNIVLLGVGGNDLLQEMSVDKAVKNLNNIIDELQSCNPFVVIFLEQIAPATTEFMTPEFIATLTDFNSRIPAIVNSQTDGSSHVVLVNMEENWSDDYMADDVHYNQAGAEVVANRYIQAILNYFN